MATAKKKLAPTPARKQVFAPDDLNAPKSFLQQADDLINGQRQKDYGDKRRNFSQIAMGMQMILSAKLLPQAKITASDVAMLMIQVKLARLTKSPEHEDSQLDVAGYIGCLNKLQQEPVEKQDALDWAMYMGYGA